MGTLKLPVYIKSSLFAFILILGSSSSILSQQVISLCRGADTTLRANVAYETIEWRDESGNILTSTDIHGVLITDSTPTVSPADTTTYTAIIVNNKGNNLISWGDFETPHPSGNWQNVSDHLYIQNTNVNYTDANPTMFSRGFYSVLNNAQELWDSTKAASTGFDPAQFYDFNWYRQVYDHTSGSGNFFVCNGNSDTTIARNVIKATVNVKGGTEYVISAWFSNIHTGWLNPYKMDIYVGNDSIGSLQGANNSDWYQKYAFWTAPADATVELKFVNTELGGGGNDFAIDDIIFAPITTQTVKVNVIPNPTVAMADTAICQGNNLTLRPEVTGGLISEYAWNDPGSILVDTTSATPSVDNTNKTPGIYPVSLTYKSGLGCVVTTPEIEITINETPIVDLRDTTICNSNSTPVPVTISTDPANVQEYLWRGATEVLNDSTIANPVTLAGTAPGIYKLKLYATNNNGCKGESLARDIVFLESPDIALYDHNTCIGSNLTIANSVLGNDTYTYEWTTVPNNIFDANDIRNPSLADPNLAVGSYDMKFKVTGNNGCADSVMNTTINVNPLPTAEITASDSTGCSPLNVEFNSTQTAVNYYWDFGDATKSNSKVSQNIFYATTDTTYNVELVIVNSSLCRDTVIKQIDVSAGAEAVFAVDSFIKTYPNTTFTVTNPNPVPGASYVWTANGGQTMFGSGDNPTVINDPSFDITYSPPGDNYSSFTINMTASMGVCNNPTSRTVTIIPADEIEPDSLFISHTDLDGCVPFEIQLGASSGLVFDTIYWSLDGEYQRSGNMFDYIFIEEGNHYVTVNGVLSTGVNVTKTYNITVSEVDSLAFESLQDYVALPDERVQFHSLTVLDSAVWNFGDGNYSTEMHPNHLYEFEGVFDVMLIGYEGVCSDTLIKREAITVVDNSYIKYPNAFAPSNDSPEDGSYIKEDILNNIFHPSFRGIESYSLYIYNRWGEEIFVTDDISKGWNGKYGNTGKRVSMGVYYWKANGTYISGKSWEVTGDVTLIWQ